MRRWTWWKDLLDLFYPHICLACAFRHPLPEEPICPACLGQLPYTQFYQQLENPFTEVFWGRVPIQTGAAYLYFRKEGRVQTLVHALKYRRKDRVGLFLGHRFGLCLQEYDWYNSVDAIIPVPLHPRKLRQRGYNQSEKFGRGISEAMDIPLFKKVLTRTRNTPSQTKIGRWGRIQNVAGAFALQKPEQIQNMHVLLVDDILTTGATLEACALQLLAVPGVKVSMATIGFAK